jgi:hypothetical protein
MYKFRNIEKLIESSIEKLQPPEKLGPGPVWREKSANSGSKGNYNNNNFKNKKRDFNKKKSFQVRPKNK